MPPKKAVRQATPVRASPRILSRDPTPTEAPSEDSLAAVGGKANNAYGTKGRAKKTKDVDAVGETFEGALRAARDAAPDSTIPALAPVPEEEEDVARDTTSQLEPAQTIQTTHVDPDSPRQATGSPTLTYILIALLTVALGAGFLYFQSHQFSHLLNHHFEHLSTDIGTRNDRWAVRFIKEIEKHAAPTMSTIERILNDENVALHTRKNWFQVAYRARVDPVLSSPSLYHWIDAKSDVIQYPFVGEETLRSGPDVTLKRSLGPEDCWCTSVKHRGEPNGDIQASNPFYVFKAQLAIELGFFVVPTRIVIEYAHTDTAMDMKAAPVDIELWAEFDSIEAVNDAWASTLGCSHEEISEKRPPYDDAPAVWSAPAHRLYQALHNINLPWKKVDPAHMRMPKNFVRMQRLTFDPEAVNWVQGFDLGAVFGPLGTAGKTGKLVLRVLSNYGQEYTCLYRVRLEGSDKGIEGMVAYNGRGRKHLGV